MNLFLHTPQLAISCSIQRGCDSEIHSGYPERMLFNGVDALIKKGKKKKKNEEAMIVREADSGGWRSWWDF